MMSVGSIAVGDVHLFFNDQMVDEKNKYNACVDICTFFVVNTRNNFPFSLPLTKAENSFLAHDSYLCCSHPCTLDYAQRIPKKSYKGTLSKKTLQAIEAFLPVVETLSVIDRTPIMAALKAKIAALP